MIETHEVANQVPPLEGYDAYGADPWLRAAVAHHLFEGERMYSEELEISHYKWTESALERVRRAYEMVSAQGIPWAREYKTILEHYERHGRFAWETFGGEIVEPELSA